MWRELIFKIIDFEFSKIVLDNLFLHTNHLRLGRKNNNQGPKNLPCHSTEDTFMKT